MDRVWVAYRLGQSDGYECGRYGGKPPEIYKYADDMIHLSDEYIALLHQLEVKDE